MKRNAPVVALGALLGATLLPGCSATTRAERLDAKGRREKKPDRAIDDFTQAIELDPGRADFWIHRGDARAKQEDWDGAIADFTEALRLEPGARAHLHRARARRQRGLLDLALADAQAAAELDPDFEDAADKERERIRAAMTDRTKNKD